MVSLTTVALLDDLDGSKAAETVAFGVDGMSYEIDLSSKNAKALRKALAEFTEAARPVTPPQPASLALSRRGSKATPARAPRDVTAAIRAWAVEQGIEVSSRGRIPAAVLDQYETLVPATR